MAVWIYSVWWVVRIINISASCGITGFESPAKDYHQKALDLDDLLIETPSATQVYLAQGDELQNIGVFDGDLLVVDQSKMVVCNDLIVAELNGELITTLINTKYQVLYSDPGGSNSITIQEFDEFVVKGVVTRSVRCHRPVSGLQCLVIT